MEAMIGWAVTKVVENIYIWHQQELQPERLSDNMLSLFQKFKASYDSKNTTELSRTISDSYSGSFYQAKTKSALIHFFNKNFNALPAFLYPRLTINVYQILEDHNQVFRAIVDFKSDLNVAFVPVASYDSGRVYIEACPDGAYGIWKIKSIDTIKD